MGRVPVGWTLLLVVKRPLGKLEEFACDVALDATSDFTARLAFRPSAIDVRLGGFVAAHSLEVDNVDGPVQLPVALAVQAMTGRLTG